MALTLATQQGKNLSQTPPLPGTPTLRDCDPGPHWGCTPTDDHGQQRIATVSRPHRSVAVARVRPGRSMTRIVSRTEEVGRAPVRHDPDRAEDDPERPSSHGQH